jgi:hypothetical protein
MRLTGRRGVRGRETGPAEREGSWASQFSNIVKLNDSPCDTEANPTTRILRPTAARWLTARQVLLNDGPAPVVGEGVRMERERMRERSRNFDFLRAAWLRGRPVVPLVGAGISVPAGLPTTRQIADYLVRFRVLADLEGWGTDPSEYVAMRGWPSRHQLNVDVAVRPAVVAPVAAERGQIAAGFRDQFTKFKEVLSREALKSELGGEHPTTARLIEMLGERLGSELPDSNRDWVAFLQSVTAGKQSLVDMFFDRLIRKRKPFLGHRFVAFLTRFLNWNTIITTNFDELIELALREEGITPVIYELVSGASIPDPRLVANHISVVKIHGGSFGLRAGHDLNDPVDETTAVFFDRCLPRDAVLLVVGYGGEDPRIKSLLDLLVSGPRLDRLADLGPTQIQGREVVWVYWGKDKPTDLPRGVAAKTRYISTSEVGLFLQELYTRLSLSHAVGKQPYRALQQVPELFEPRPAKDNAERRSPRTARRKLWDDAIKHRDHITLWFNLYEIDSLATFLASLADQVRVHDRHFPPRVLSATVATKTQEQARGGGGDDEAVEAFRISLRPWCLRLASALRRGRYFIAIDGVRAFANTHPAWCNEDEEDKGDVPYAASIGWPFRIFIEELTAVTKEPKETGVEESMPSGLGESCIGIVLEEEDESEFVKRVQRDGIILYPCDPPGSAETAPDMSSISSSAGYQDDPVLPLREIAEAVLDTSASFRRPRSLVGLLRVTAALLRERHKDDDALLTLERRSETEGKLVPPEDTRFAPWRIAGQNALIYRRIEAAIEWLAEAGCLLPLDGGFYSMDYGLREARFDAIPAGEAMFLQAAVADYYRTVLYEQSHDLGAYCEYLFHQIAWINLHRTSAKPEEVRREIAWLIGSITREKSHLVGRGYPSAMLHALQRMKKFLTDLKEIDTKDAVAALETMELEVWTSVTDYVPCIARHRSRLLGGPENRSLRPQAVLSEALEWLPEVTRPSHPDALRRVKAAIDLGTCVCAPRVTHNAEDDTLKRVEKLFRGCLKALRQFDGGQQSQEVAQLEIAALTGLMEARLRNANAWTNAPLWKKRDHDLIACLFDQTENRLRKEPDASAGRLIRGRMRCWLARSLLFLGRSGQANEELNKAHGFMSRVQGAEGAAGMAFYHLHRAEYCLHGAVVDRGGDDVPVTPEVSWLLDAAAAALEQTELLLGDGPRDAFSWGRLFVLKARLGLERIVVARKQLSAAFQSTSAEGGRLVERAYSLIANIEDQFVASLHALEGGLANTYMMEERGALFDDIWDRLEAEHEALVRLTRDETSQADHWRLWRRLNARADMLPYFERRKTPVVVEGWRVRSNGTIWKVRDFCDRGISVDEESGRVFGPIKVALESPDGKGAEGIVAVVVSPRNAGAKPYWALHLERPNFATRLRLRKLHQMALEARGGPS